MNLCFRLESSDVWVCTIAYCAILQNIQSQAESQLKCCPALLGNCPLIIFFSCHFCYIFFFSQLAIWFNAFFFGKSGKSIHKQSGTWTYKMLVNSNARFQLIWVHYHITNPFMIQEDNFDVYSMCSFLGVLIMKTYLFQCFMNKIFSNHHHISYHQSINMWGEV